jgi:hypothetical protein
LIYFFFEPIKTATKTIMKVRYTLQLPKKVTVVSLGMEISKFSINTKIAAIVLYNQALPFASVKKFFVNSITPIKISTEATILKSQVGIFEFDTKLAIKTATFQSIKITKSLKIIIAIFSIFKE